MKTSHHRNNKAGLEAGLNTCQRTHREPEQDIMDEMAWRLEKWEVTAREIEELWTISLKTVKPHEVKWKPEHVFGENCEWHRGWSLICKRSWRNQEGRPPRERDEVAVRGPWLRNCKARRIVGVIESLHVTNTVEKTFKASQSPLHVALGERKGECF